MSKCLSSSVPSELQLVVLEADIFARSIDQLNVNQPNRILLLVSEVSFNGSSHKTRILIKGETT